MALIIAEAGTGHWDAYYDERCHLALNLVEAAAEAGAGAVKFQMFVPDEPLFCPLNGDTIRMERWKNTVMEEGDWIALKAHAEHLGLIFVCSVFQLEALELYKSLNPVVYKVASRAAETFPYRAATGEFWVSCGLGAPMLNYDVHQRAVLFECESKYPSTLRWAGNHNGFSDHSGNPWRAIDAIARGATHVEVHLDLGNAGPDAPAALSPDQLKTICEFNREITGG